MNLQDKINAFDKIESDKKQVGLDKEHMRKLYQTATLPDPSFWGHVLHAFTLTAIMFSLAWLLGCVYTELRACSFVTSFSETLIAMLIIPVLVSPLIAHHVVKETRAEITRARALIKYLDGEK
ncbi:MAG: hypothetical protein GOV00_00435 [Candidatus Altiarchaeota archaeon]|nr:hypothetical protein [Candidatus Altiarchaeota archaeon]